MTNVSDFLWGFLCMALDNELQVKAVKGEKRKRNFKPKGCITEKQTHLEEYSCSACLLTSCLDFEEAELQEEDTPSRERSSAGSVWPLSMESISLGSSWVTSLEADFISGIWATWNLPIHMWVTQRSVSETTELSVYVRMRPNQHTWWFTGLLQNLVRLSELWH